MTQPLAPIEQAAEAAGSWFALAQKLKVSHQSVYQWKSRGFFPLRRALEIELHYGIPAKDLIDPALREIADLLNL